MNKTEMQREIKRLMDINESQAKRLDEVYEQRSRAEGALNDLLTLHPELKFYRRFGHYWEMAWDYGLITQLAEAKKYMDKLQASVAAREKITESILKVLNADEEGDDA